MFGGLLAVLAGLWFWQARQHGGTANQTPDEQTIESSGEILGLAIGSTMEDARKRLDPLKVPADYTPDQKETTGRRIYWKLKETDYDWLMAWAKPDGRITRIRAVFRPGRTRPFSAIGNLRTAAHVDAESVRWNLQRPDGPHFRLIAQGANQQAASVYMFSLELSADRHEQMNVVRKKMNKALRSPEHESNAQVRS